MDFSQFIKNNQILLIISFVLIAGIITLWKINSKLKEKLNKTKKNSKRKYLKKLKKLKKE